MSRLVVRTVWARATPSSRGLCTTGGKALSGNNGKVYTPEQIKPQVDFKFIVEHVQELEENVKLRNGLGSPAKAAELYQSLRASRTALQTLLTRKNAIAGDRTMPKEQRAEEGRRVRAEIVEVEAENGRLEEAALEEALQLPNITHPDVPIGPEDNARTVRLIGTKPDAATVDHTLIGEAFDAFDFSRASLVTGSRFAFLRNGGAMLELECVKWAMEKVVSKGFTPLMTPDLVRSAVVNACGFQARGDNSQIYEVMGTPLSLVGTAELPLAGYYVNTILPVEELPIKMVAFSHCFRKEAGAGGKQEGGLYRLHQFSKVEMFVIGRPSDSDKTLQELVDIQCELVEELGLHARVLMMPTEELGASAYQKFDIEAWMPGRGTYGEITSATNCLDYQARRLSIRFRNEDGKVEFAHTLNATACAVPRVMLSLLETHVQPDGSVKLPQALSGAQMWFNADKRRK